MSANPRGILAIDLLVAAQCFGFWERLSSSTALMKVKAVLAEGVSFYDKIDTLAQILSMQINYFLKHYTTGLCQQSRSLAGRHSLVSSLVSSLISCLPNNFIHGCANDK